MYTYRLEYQLATMFPFKLDNGTTLRPLTVADAKVLFGCINDNRQHLSRWFPWVSETKKIEDSMKFLKKAEVEHLSLSALHLGIFSSGEQKLLGSVAFREIRKADNTGVLGFWLASESENKGIAITACKTLIHYGKSIGLNHFEIHTSVDNNRAQSLAQKLHFRKVPGIIRSAEIIDSKLVDHSVFVLDDHSCISSTFYLLIKRSVVIFLFIGVLAAAIVMAKFSNAKPSSGLYGKHLLLVGGPWNDTVQRFWFTTGREAGLEISVVEKPGHWTQGAASTALIYSFHPVNLDLPTNDLADKLVDVLLHSGIEFSGIMTLKDTYLVAVAEAAHRIGLPTIGPDVYQHLRDKETLRIYTNSNIRTYRITHAENLAAAGEVVGFPAVLKPAQGEGSLGVHLVSSPSEFEMVYQKIHSKLPSLTSILGDYPDLLLEQYIDGTEHNIELIMENGKALFAAVSDDRLGVLPWFQEEGHSHPSKLAASQQEALTRCSIQVCKQLNLTDGVVHVEMKLSENGPQLIEVNARMGGLYIWHGVKSVWEVDLLLHAYEIALGLPVSMLPNRGSLDVQTYTPKVFVVSRYPNAPFTGFVLRKDFLKPYENDTRVSYPFAAVNVGQKVYGPEDDTPFWLGMFQVNGNNSMADTEDLADQMVLDMQLSSILSKTAPLDILSVASTPVKGMEDVYGLQRRRFHAVSRTLESVAYRFGYDEILMPLVERASSFSEGIVGQSPWPEWDPRGCFFFDITDYTNGFSMELNKIPVVLIPEGTISVARWLGLQITSNPDLVFPIKIFYNVPCFRNEPVNTLSNRKKRQFDQFGIEILGTENLGADVEIIWMMGDMLEALGIPKSNMVVRVSNIQILIHLLKDSGVVHPDDIKIKEAMDEMAECRAKGTFDCVKNNEARFWDVLNKYHLMDEIKIAWRAMLQHDSGIVNDELRNRFPASYKSLFDELELISTQLLNYDLKVIADLCVVRSHEYYTHFSFEIDVKIEKKLYLEIAGGGRYNKLVGHFIDSRHPIDVVPSTGFAFGIQRLMSMLEEIGVFSNHLLQPQLQLPLSDSSAEILLVPNVTRSNKVESYLETHKWLSKQSRELANRRFDIYLGDNAWIKSVNDNPIQSYQQKRKIKKVIKVP